MLIDAFTFFNELDLLEDRLEYLYNHVDYFVIGECNLTHSGKIKPMYYLENKERYKKYQDKILHVSYILDPNQSYDSWYIERNQRNKLMTALVDFPDDTVVMITDLDEIPNIDTFIELQNKVQNKLIVHMFFDLFYYNLKCKLEDTVWMHPVAGKKKDIDFYTADEFRCMLSDRMVDDRDWVFNGGWHLSFFGSARDIVTKLRSYAHTEFSGEEYTNEERIRDQIKNKENMRVNHNQNAKLITPTISSFPDHFLRVFGKYYRD